jgi:hypothetical protein
MENDEERIAAFKKAIALVDEQQGLSNLQKQAISTAARSMSTGTELPLPTKGGGDEWADLPTLDEVTPLEETAYYEDCPPLVDEKAPHFHRLAYRRRHAFSRPREEEEIPYGLQAMRAVQKATVISPNPVIPRDYTPMPPIAIEQVTQPSAPHIGKSYNPRVQDDKRAFAEQVIRVFELSKGAAILEIERARQHPVWWQPAEIDDDNDKPAAGEEEEVVINPRICLVQWIKREEEEDNHYVWTGDVKIFNVGGGEIGPTRAELWIQSRLRLEMPSTYVTLGRFVSTLYRFLAARPTMNATLVHFLEGEIIRHVAGIIAPGKRSPPPMTFSKQDVEEAVGMVMAAMDSISPDYLIFHYCNYNGSHYSIPLGLAEKYSVEDGGTQ